MASDPLGNMMSKRGNHWISLDILMVFLLAILSCVYIFTTASIENYGSDTSTYCELARSIRWDHKYSFNFEPHTMYPPGFPLLLAGIMSLVAESFHALMKFSVLISFIALVGIYFLMKIQRGSITAFAVVILVATSQSFYFWSTVGLHSDVLYLTVSIYSLLFFEIGNKADNHWKKISSYFLVAILTSYLIMVRSIGITFILGFILWMLNPLRWRFVDPADSSIKRVKRWFPAVLLPMFVLFVWTSWCSQNRNSAQEGDYMNSYSKQMIKEDPHQIDSPNISLRKIPARLLSMLVVRTDNAAKTLFNMPSRTLKWYNPLFLVFFITLSTGFLISFLREGKLLDWYVLCYSGILLLHPFDEGTRFILPIQPFLYVYGIIGLESVVGFVKSENIKKYSFIFVIIFAIMSGYVIAMVLSLGKTTKNDLVSFIVWSLFFFYSLFFHFKKQKIAPSATKTLDNKNMFSFAPFKDDRVLSFLNPFLICCIIVAGIFQIRALARQNLNPDSNTFINAPTVEVSKWVTRNTQANDAIMDDQYQILHRLTKRKTFRFPLTTDLNILKDKIISNRIRFIVVLNEKEYEYFNPSTMRRFAKLRETYPELFRLVYVFKQGKIYMVDLTRKSFAPLIPARELTT